MRRLGTIHAAQAAGVLAGVCVAFPSFLIPGTADGSGPRTTDILSLTSAGLLAAVLLRGGILHPVIRLITLFWLLSVGWVCVEVYISSPETAAPVQRLLVRWLLCGCSAYWITVLMQDARTRYLVVLGVLLGLIFSFSTIVWDSITFSPEDLPLAVLVDLAIYNGKSIHDFIYRAYGIFGHPNGAAGCVLIGVPFLIGLIEEKKIPRYCIALALILMAGTFYLTKSRGPLLTSLGLILFWIVACNRRSGAILASIGTAAAVGVMALVFGEISSTIQDALLDRFTDTGSITVNVDDRWWTIAAAMRMILTHPLGMGSGYLEPLAIETGTTATHNAYLELALMGGVPLALLVAVRLLRTASWLFTPNRPIEAWVAAYLACIFLFETYFLQVNIPILTLWLLRGPAQRLGRAEQPRRGLTPARQAAEL